MGCSILHCNFFTLKNKTMKNQEMINRLTELAKPKNLDERKEKRDLSSMAYCEINEITDVVSVSISFNNDDVWYEYYVDFVNVVEHICDVSGGQALIEYDFEGNLTQWIPIEDVEIDGYDVLEYLIDNALLKSYSAITNTENF
jgi:hypothetical protein